MVSYIIELFCFYYRRNPCVTSMPSFHSRTACWTFWRFNVTVTRDHFRLADGIYIEESGSLSLRSRACCLAPRKSCGYVRIFFFKKKCPIEQSFPDERRVVSYLIFDILHIIDDSVLGYSTGTACSAVGKIL